MRSRAVRLTLTLLAVVAIGAAAYFSWTTRARSRAAAERAAALDAARAAGIRAAIELRAAQQAYVAAGQSEAFWFEKAGALTDSLRATLATLAAAAPTPGARADLEEALAALQDFEQSDRRIRRYASSGQKLLASDIIFSDGLETSARIISALDRAGTVSAGAAAADHAAAAREQLVAIAAAAGLAMLVMVLLVPIPRAAASAPLRPVEPNTRDVRPGLDLRSVPGTERPAALPEATAPVASIPQSPIEIQKLAGICGDLARLADVENLPAIMAKTAAALDASGLVLWVVDPDGKELLPMAAYGYPASVLSRMGTISTDAENATAAAFRTGLLQTVGADEGSQGAIAAPLVSPSGPRGVMAAEVRHQGEKEPSRLAAASIVAAQLAVIIGPPAAQNEDRSTAAL